MASMEQRMKHETELRDYAIARIENEIPYCRLNGDRVKRVRITLTSASNLLKENLC